MKRTNKTTLKSDIQILQERIKVKQNVMEAIQYILDHYELKDAVVVYKDGGLAEVFQGYFVPVGERSTSAHVALKEFDHEYHAIRLVKEDNLVVIQTGNVAKNWDGESFAIDLRTYQICQ